MIVGPIVVKSPGKQASAVGVAQAINLGSFADPNAASSWTETIDWGDNTSSTLHLPPGSLGKLNHTYAKKGTRTVTVTVTDNLGVTASYSFTVSVSAKNNGPNSSPAVSSAALVRLGDKHIQRQCDFQQWRRRSDGISHARNPRHRAARGRVRPGIEPGDCQEEQGERLIGRTSGPSAFLCGCRRFSAGLAALIHLVDAP